MEIPALVGSDRIADAGTLASLDKAHGGQKLASRQTIRYWGGGAPSGPFPLDSNYHPIALSKSTASLGSRPYWQRIWSLQEVAFANTHYWTLANESQQTGDIMNFFRMGAHFLMSLKAKNEL